TDSSSKHTADEALRGLLEFLAFSIQSSPGLFLLLPTVYHVLTSLFVDSLDRCNHASCMGVCPQPLAAACPRYLRPAATRPIRDIHQKGSSVHQQNGVIPLTHSFGNSLDRITYKQAWARSIALLLDDDGQVHIQVDATVEMEGAGSVEWSNGHTLTGNVELQVVDDRCIRFSSWFSDVIHPGAIANNV